MPARRCDFQGAAARPRGCSARITRIRSRPANIAAWTGECGDAREALRLFQALLPDRERVLGADHPDTLSTRNNIAFWTGQCGDAREALRLSQALLPDGARARRRSPGHAENAH